MSRLSELYLKNRKPIHSLIIIIVISLFVEILFIIFPGTEAELWEQRLADNFFRLRYKLKGQEPISPALATVGLKTSAPADLQAYNQGSLMLYASLLEKLTPLGIKSIAIDILFAGNGSPGEKKTLANLTNELENIYYPVVPLTEPYIQRPEDYHEGNLFQNIDIKNKNAIPRAGAVLLPYKELAGSAKGLGHIRYLPGVDGITRKLPLFFRYNEKYIPCLALRIACDFLNVKPENMKIAEGKYLLLKEARFPSGLKKDIKIPVDSLGQMNLNFSGPDAGRFPNYSLMEIINLDDAYPLIDYLEETILFVFDGTIASKDFTTGIFHQEYPLVHLQLEAINTILKNNFLYSYTSGQKILWKLFLCLIIWLLGVKGSLRIFISGCAVLVIIFAALNFLFFFFADRLPYLLNPLLFIMLSGSAVGMYRYTEQIKEDFRKKEREQQKLIQANKLITLGTMVSGIAHEVANPNNAIMLEADYLEESTTYLNNLIEAIEEKEPDLIHRILPRPYWKEDLLQSFQGVKECSRKIAKIIMELKNFYKKTGPEMQAPVDLNKVIRSSLYILSYTLRKNAVVHYTPRETEKLMIHGNSQQVEQALVNLLTNSCHALGARQKGNIYISAGFIPGERRIKVSVTDDGEGMNNEILERVTEPFFTTRQCAGGTGLGLYIVNKILNQHEGELQITSKVNSGTTVTLLFPSLNAEGTL